MVGGGPSNTAYLLYSTVAGGIGNVAVGNAATVAGRWELGVRAGAVIAGGYTNQVSAVLTVTDGAMTATSTALACATSLPTASPYVAGEDGDRPRRRDGAGAHDDRRGGGPRRAADLDHRHGHQPGHVVLNDAAVTTVSAATVIILSPTHLRELLRHHWRTPEPDRPEVPGPVLRDRRGRQNIVTLAQYSTIAGGYLNTCSASYALVSGYNALGDHSGGSPVAGMFTTQGDNQYELVTLYRKIVNTTSAKELFLDGTGLRLTSTRTTRLPVRRRGAGEADGRDRHQRMGSKGGAMGAGAATMVLKQAPTITAIYADSATTTLAVTADTTHGALAMTFADSAGGAVTWDVAADIQVRKISG